MNEVTLTFCSGVGTATGANFLMETPEKVKILVDCGLIQGVPNSHVVNGAPFMYKPEEVQFLFITHAHADHIGRIPKLVKEGFRGEIYSTSETLSLAEVMLPDMLQQVEREARETGVLAPYSKADIEMALSLWNGVKYHDHKTLAGFDIYFRDAGHILGSSMITFTRNGKNIVFTGDLGNSPSPLLRDTEVVSDATYMVMESVYGDRNHEPQEERQEKFKQVILEAEQTAGTLLIPSFSIERTQVILHELTHLVKMKEIPVFPVFLDSPLAEKVTTVYEHYMQDFNSHIQEDIKNGTGLFKFQGLRIVRSADESNMIEGVHGSKIIIAGSGMSVGGRIMHHEIQYLGDPKNTLLLVGYQAMGTLGRKIQDGQKIVKISGVPVEVKARVRGIFGYSSHKDSDHLVEFVANTAKTVKKIYVAMGEPKSSLFLVQKLRDNLDVDAVYPAMGQSVKLEF